MARPSSRAGGPVRAIPAAAGTPGASSGRPSAYWPSQRLSRRDHAASRAASSRDRSSEQVRGQRPSRLTRHGRPGYQWGTPRRLPPWPARPPRPVLRRGQRHVDNSFAAPGSAARAEQPPTRPPGGTRPGALRRRDPRAGRHPGAEASGRAASSYARPPGGSPSRDGRAARPCLSRGDASACIVWSRGPRRPRTSRSLPARPACRPSRGGSRRTPCCRPTPIPARPSA